MTVADPRTLLSSLFHVAVAAADPGKIMSAWLPEPPRGRTVVIGAGKGAAAMACAFDEAWPHELQGVVVTRYGYAVPCRRIQVLEAAHPMPDEAGLEASRVMMKAVSGLTSDDLVVALISGGGSALLPAPPDGLTLADEQDFTRALLESGLPISDMNLLRKHVSRIKGGRLALAVAPARLVTLVLSDVPGDNPAYVASGPTVPDPGTRADALALIAQTRLLLPNRVMQHLRSPSADAPLPSDPALGNQEVHVIGSASVSLDAAAAQCMHQFGLPAVILSDRIEGEAREIGRMHAAIACEVATRNRPFSRPVLLLSGGETGVAVSGFAGRGGRNTEFALSLAIGVQTMRGISALAADTDGIDGSNESAGAFVDTTTVSRLRQAGVDPKKSLADHSSGDAFDLIGDSFVTGPTRTNVNDFRAILIDDV